MLLMAQVFQGAQNEVRFSFLKGESLACIFEGFKKGFNA
jgi:hypothetical protein